MEANLGFKGTDASGKILVFCKVFLHTRCLQSFLFHSLQSVLLEQHRSFIKSHLLHGILQAVIVPSWDLLKCLSHLFETSEAALKSWDAGNGRKYTQVFM